MLVVVFIIRQILLYSLRLMVSGSNICANFHYTVKLNNSEEF